MPQNGILHEGIAALAEAFKSNPNVKVCKLSITLPSFTVFVFLYVHLMEMRSNGQVVDDLSFRPVSLCSSLTIALFL